MSSRPRVQPSAPLIGLLERAARAMVADMVRSAAERGFPEVRASHNAVFATLAAEGSRVSDMAAQAGITKQSVGEMVRDLEQAGLVEIRPDPTDGRAKIVRYTKRGWQCVRSGESHIRSVDALLASTLGADRMADLRVMLTEIADLLERAGTVVEHSAASRSPDE